MKAQHIPGPWKAYKNEVRPASGKGSTGGYAPIVRVQLDKRVDGDVEATARLIAAAPELLSALRAIAGGQVMSGSFTHADTVLRYQEIARAAIAKVKGKS